MKSNDAPLMPLPDHADATPGAGAKGEVVKGRSFFRKGGRLLLGAGLLSLACLLGVFSLALLIVRIDPFPRGPAAPTFEEKHPTVGEAAPDFTLKDLQGEPYHLRERLGQRPLVIEFGSLT